MKDEVRVHPSCVKCVYKTLLDPRKTLTDLDSAYIGITHK